MVFAFDYDHPVIRSLAVIYPSGNYETDLAEILSHDEGQFSPENSQSFRPTFTKTFQKPLEN